MLFNFYISFIAFLYQPAVDLSKKNIQGTRGSTREEIEADRERQHIMNEFYQTELNELDESGEIAEGDQEMGKYQAVSMGETAQRRDLKRPPKEKAKEKLWDALVKEAMEKRGEEDSESDDDKIWDPKPSDQIRNF